MDSPSFKRQVAFKLWIKELLGGTYIKEEGLRPNYVLLANGKKVSRVNLLGVVVSVSTEGMQSLLLDDGTGSIVVRAFEPIEIISKLEPGTIVFIVGRPREFSNELYILPEIIKKVDDATWVEVRKAELGAPKQEIQEPKKEIEVKNEDTEKIVNFVREIDKGQGASIDDITAQFPGCEKLIENLLSNGALFEVRPGMLKVLE